MDSDDESATAPTAMASATAPLTIVSDNKSVELMNPSLIFPPPLERQECIGDVKSFDELLAQLPVFTRCTELQEIMTKVSCDSDDITRGGFDRDQVRARHIQAHEEVTELLASKKLLLETAKPVLKKMLQAQQKLHDVLFVGGRTSVDYKGMFMRTYANVHNTNIKLFMELKQVERDISECKATLQTIAIFCY